MMSATRSRFRAAAKNALVASTIFASASAFTVGTSLPAIAGDPSVEQCEAKYGKTERAIACASDAHDRRQAIAREKIERARAESARARAESTKARAEGAAADKTLEEAKAVGVCIDYLIAGMNSGAFSKQEVLTKAGGLEKLRQGDTPCVVAKQFGYGKKVEAQPQ